MSPQPTVHAIVPLALLEAIRNLDTPLNDGLSAELAQETFTKRFGLTTTVAAQIQRYKDMVGKATPVGLDEVVQLFRLAGRRADATLVYSDAGRRAARYASRTRGGSPLVGWKLMPKPMRRRAGERAAARVMDRIFGLALVRDSSGIHLELAESLATRAGFEGSGCYFYSALTAELLRVTSGFEGSILQDRCRSRGDEQCRWRAAEADQRWQGEG